jgi:predicted transcriptional regulator
LHHATQAELSSLMPKEIIIPKKLLPVLNEIKERGEVSTGEILAGGRCLRTLRIHITKLHGLKAIAPARMEGKTVIWQATA